MTGLESLLRPDPRLTAAAVALAALLASAGCAGNPAPAGEPPPPPASVGDEAAPTAAEQAPAEAPPEPADEASAADPGEPLAAETEADAAVRSPTPESAEDLVVVEAGGVEPGSERRSLVEAARAERSRRSQTAGPEIVITDKNLADYASGDLTIARSEPVGGGAELDEETPEAGAPEEPGEAPDGPQDEDDWRSRALEIRLDWRAASERIAELEERVAELRNRFYAEDDGFYRDSQIKPAWDRAIDDLRQARLDVERHREELEALLEEGRRAGALPGWLREGIEYEPEPLPVPEAIHEPGEPPVADEGEDGG